MSEPGRHARVDQEPDHSFNLKLIGVALVALAVFFGGVYWAYLVLDARAHKLVPRGEPIPPEVRQPEVGMVIKTLFGADSRFAERRRRQEERLQGYGWVDRQKGIIHIPIERAMELVARAGRQP